MQFPDLPNYELAAGLRTPFGLWLPPSGGKVAAYVRSTGPQSGDSEEIISKLVTTLNAGLIRCRANAGDIVVCLPGHSESISTADAMSNLVAGTRIIGLGRGTLRPKLTWTAAAATFLFDVANVELSGFWLEMAGDPAGTTALSVAAPITISAAGCAIRDCIIRTSVDADQLATIPITTTAAADDLTLEDLVMFGATAGESTTFVRLVGADRLIMRRCRLMGATSSTTVGVVQCITTASTDILVEDCAFQNRKAASVHAFTGLAAVSGIVRRCQFGILDNATLAGLVTPGDLQGFANRTANLAGEQGQETTVQSV